MAYGQDEIVHSVRRKVRLGVKIKTRCGVEVERTSMENRQLFKTVIGDSRVRCVVPGPRQAPTCRRCCQLLGVPVDIGGAMIVLKKRVGAGVRQRKEQETTNDGT